MSVYVNGQWVENGSSNSTFFFHDCPEEECHCFDTLMSEWRAETAFPKEDPLDDPAHQEPGELPAPVEGNDDADDTEPNPDSDDGTGDTPEGEE